MSAQTPAQALLTNNDFRFTIRETGGRALRKLMTGERFLAKRADYIGKKCSC